MASQSDGGFTCPGNLQVFGDSDVNGDQTVNGALTVDGETTSATLTVTGAAQAANMVASYLSLTPSASPPTPPTEGMVYADTDHKLYFYNGTAWKEVTFAA